MNFVSKVFLIGLVSINVSADNSDVHRQKLACNYIYKANSFAGNDQAEQFLIQDVSGSSVLKTLRSHLTEEYSDRWDRLFDIIDKARDFEKIPVQKDIYEDDSKFPGMTIIQDVIARSGLNIETTFVPLNGQATGFILGEDRLDQQLLFLIDAQDPNKMVPQLVVFEVNDQGIRIMKVLKSDQSERIKKTIVLDGNKDNVKQVMHFSASCVSSRLL